MEVKAEHLLLMSLALAGGIFIALWVAPYWQNALTPAAAAPVA